MVPQRGFFERFDASDGIGGLFHRLVDVADSLALHGLNIAILHQLADGSADSISGTIVGLDQRIL